MGLECPSFQHALSAVARTGAAGTRRGRWHAPGRGPLASARGRWHTPGAAGPPRRPLGWTWGALLPISPAVESALPWDSYSSGFYYAVILIYYVLSHVCNDCGWLDHAFHREASPLV